MKIEVSIASARSRRSNNPSPLSPSVIRRWALDIAQRGYVTSASGQINERKARNRARGLPLQLSIRAPSVLP
jgi:hypothetical protein